MAVATAQTSEAEEEEDEFVHPGTIVLNGDDIPQQSGQSQQSQIDRGHCHHEQAGQHHAREVRLQERSKSCKSRHAKGRMLEDVGRKNQPVVRTVGQPVVGLRVRPDGYRDEGGMDWTISARLIR